MAAKPPSSSDAPGGGASSSVGVGVGGGSGSGSGGLLAVGIGAVALALGVGLLVGRRVEHRRALDHAAREAARCPVPLAIPFTPIAITPRRPGAPPSTLAVSVPGPKLVGEGKGVDEEKKEPEIMVVKPYVSGEVTLIARHMYDEKAPTLEFVCPADDAQYSLRPKYIPNTADPTRPIIYHDPEDPAYFARPLPTRPVLRCWILIKNVRWSNGGYVKRRLAEEMRRHNVSVRLIHPMKCDLLVSKDGLEEIVYAGEKIALPDCVIPRVGANVDYFGLAIMRQLETLRVHMFNPSPSIEISRDKLYTHQIMASRGVPIPKSVLGRKPIEYPFIQAHFGYPVIVKLTSGSKGDAVWKVDNEDELKKLMATLEDNTKPIIFQEFIGYNKGRDIRCVVVGDKVVASMVRRAKSGFKANVHQGGSVEATAIRAELEAMVAKTSTLCQLDFSGVDLLLDKNGYKVCEVNSSPGFEGLERATGIDCARAMVTYMLEQCATRRARDGARPAIEKTVDLPLQHEHYEQPPTPKLEPSAAPSAGTHHAATVATLPSLAEEPLVLPPAVAVSV